MAEGKWEDWHMGVERNFVINGAVAGYIVSLESGGYYAAVFPPGGGNQIPLKKSGDNAGEAEAKKAVEEYWENIQAAA